MFGLHRTFLIISACVAWFAKAELFTSMAHLQNALYAENNIALDIKRYIQEEERRLKELRRLSDDLENHSKKVLGNVNYHLGNPVNAYLLIKKLTVDWEKEVDPIINNSTITTLIHQIDQRKQELPRTEDLNGAAEALLRLQDTYQLDTAQIAHGDLGGLKSTELTAVECYDIGRHAYTNKDFYHTVVWMEESLDRESMEVNKTVDRANVLDYLAYAHTMQGNLRHALSLTNELLKLEPDHARARNNIRYYENMIAEENRKTHKMGDDGSTEQITNERQIDDYRKSNEFMTYESLCRGEDLPKKYKHRHKLVCRYTHKNNPELYLQPVKEEEMYLDPYIVVYHDVMSDREAETIKALATPKLNRATVQNAKTGQLEYANYRISKSAWLKAEEHPVVRRINNRIEAITNLEMDTAEELQVANYGLGGHYEPHFDFARKRKRTTFEARVGNRIATFLFYKEEKDAFKSLGTGNRIATFMFYMTDVEAGGATVFPYLGVKLWPRKGTAAFWYNLYQSGEGIYNTRHAACPVLVGTKWVSNKWIHERGQEFRRPCATNEKL